jgi:hypothetical protein
MEPEGSLSCSQESASGPYPEPNESNLHPHPHPINKERQGMIAKNDFWGSDDVSDINKTLHIHTCTCFKYMLDFTLDA